MAFFAINRTGFIPHIEIGKWAKTILFCTIYLNCNFVVNFKYIA